MTMQGKGTEASIHGWNHPSQSISWSASLLPGHYQVLMRYAQPHAGSAMTLEADGQELAALFKPYFHFGLTTPQKRSALSIFPKEEM